MWGGAWDIHRLGEVDSTNTYVRDRARHGDPAGLVAVADHQTAGRGRLDRRWESPPGANLLASVLLRPDLDGRDVHLCGGAVALAGADACREVAGVEPVLKWPNDLLLEGAKLAGVLAEAEFAGSSLTAVVVGIGINVAWPGPPEAGGTCLDDVGGRRSRWTARSSWTTSWPPWNPGVRCSKRAPGGVALADEVRRRCGTLGQQVRVTLAGEEITGRASAIDDAGRLVVDTAAGPRPVSAGDVVHLRPDQDREGLRAWANIARTMRLLVTGGAGFIGSNFARYWVEQHPEDHVVVYDVLTYAGNRPSLSDIEDRIVFVQGDICDQDAAEKAIAERGDRHDRPFRRRVAQLAGRAQPGALLPDQRARDPDDARGRPAGRRGPLPPRLDLRGLRRPAARYRRGLPRGLALPAPDALQRVEGRGGPRGACLRGDLRAPHHHHQLCQQLRPVPVPREADPALLRAGARRQGAHALRQHGEPARVAARLRPLHGHRRRDRPGPGGGDVPRRQRRGGVHHGGGGPHPRRPGQAGVAQDDRPRPPRARPPLRARLLQAPRRAGLGAVGRVGAGAGRDRGVVRRQPGVVGAAAGPGAGRRGVLGRPEAPEQCGS